MAPDYAGDVFISICICTCRRINGLIKALDSLRNLKIPDGVNVEVVIVDNDSIGSARDTVCVMSESFPFPLRYFLELNRGVSYARNRCVAESTGEWVAFIDDDEFVEDTWLFEFWNCARKESADGVFGPVIASFSEPPPLWVLSSGAHERARYPTGSLMKWRDCRSGNVLVRRSLFLFNGGFDPRFAASGGEDSDFFWRCLQAGAHFVWCDTACVHETVPANRVSRKWMLKRAFNGGRNFARLRALHRGVWSYVFDACWGGVKVAVYIPLALLARVLLRRKAFYFERKVASGLGMIIGCFVRLPSDYAVG